MNTSLHNHVAFLHSYSINIAKMKKLLFVTIFFSCTTLVRTQVPSLQEGIKYLDNENYTAALNTFTAIAKGDPKNGSIYYYIGEVSYRTEAYAEADKAYKKGLSINPQCAECKVGIGKLLLDQGKTAEAEENFTSATRLDKKNPEVFAIIGEAYLYSSKPNGNKAVQFLTTARDMNPKVAKYWANLGNAYQMIGDNGEAMTSFETAVEKDPKNTAAYISMARIWASAKQTDLAIPKLQEAIRLSPDDAPPYKDLIELYIRTGEYDKVTPLLEKYVSLTGTDVDAKVRLVKFLTFQAKDYERAIIEGEKLLKTNPEEYTLHRWLAWAYGETGQFQQSHDHSVQLFDDISKKEGRSSFPSDYDYWANASLKLGLLDEAAHIYRKYLDLDPTRSLEIYGILAKAYYDAKNYEQAISYFKRKAELKPLSNADEYSMGLAYYFSDKNLEADSSFARVMAATPEWAPVWIMRARVAVELDPENKEYLAKPYYEGYIPLGEVDKVKNKKTLTEAYNYMAIYNVQHDDNKLALELFEKTLAIDSTNAVALESIKLLKGQN
jgi:tetratricopeptide (TPR) repeat protein